MPLDLKSQKEFSLTQCLPSKSTEGNNVTPTAWQGPYPGHGSLLVHYGFPRLGGGGVPKPLALVREQQGDQ